MMTEKLGLEQTPKCMVVLREAFPSVQLKEIVGCQVIFGVKLKENASGTEFPEFSEEDLCQGQEMFELEDGLAVAESCDQQMFEENVLFTEASTPLPNNPGILLK